LTPSTPKWPRATNAELVFGKEQKVVIDEELLKRSSDRTQEESNEFKLSEYNSVRKQLFNNLDDKQKEAYSEKATTQNKQLKDGPERSIIFR
jgi:hypothetical protein